MPTSTRATTRDRIVRAATDLLSAGGRAAVSTRSVSTAAGVQPPTIYRQFGDMDGLLDAVATQAFEDYLRDKRDLGETGDPVDDLRRSWDLHVDFGLTKPMFYTLGYGGPGDEKASTLRAEALERLTGMVARVAAAGRLTMSVERATALIHANGLGLVLSQIAIPPADRDPRLPAVARELVLSSITTGPTEAAGDVPSQATALRVALGNHPGNPLSPTEAALLDDWLRRLADTN
ncbi:TetR/AcrR family transcriptional regulator [Kribbella sp. NPDC051770]|uniref:TetR/AcrR family transcriptional regulator n=1 Tax=Kribbella sp. NPDC051770 TaxID=3155413 RepID=UPI00343AA779